MTTNVTQTEWPYEGDGAQTVWPYTFSITSNDDVELFVALNGALVSTKIDPSLYTVTYDPVTKGGTVTYPKTGSPLTVNDKLAVKRATVQKQGFGLGNQEFLTGDSIEESDDNLSRQVQDIANELKRAVKTDVTSEEDPQDIIVDIEEARLDAEQSAAEAATSASAASTSASNAATSESNAAVSASNAATSEANAANSEANAATSELNAATSASNAATSETNAATSAAEAEAQAIIAREGWEGEWYAGTTYAENEKVQYQGSSYISLQDSNTGNTPEVGGTAWWDLIALKGTDGTFTRFTDLLDTPASYSGQSGKIPRVNSAEDSLEFYEIPLKTWECINVNVEYVDSNSVSVSAGVVRNAEDSANISVVSNPDVTAALVADETYHVNVDSAGVSTISTSIATGTSRTIGTFITNSGGNIRPFVSRLRPDGSLDIEYVTPVIDFPDVSTPAGLKTFTIPSGVRTRVKINSYHNTPNSYGSFIDPSIAAFTPGLSNSKMACFSNTSDIAKNQIEEVYSNTSAQLRLVASASLDLRTTTHGYINERNF